MDNIFFINFSDDLITQDFSKRDEPHDPYLTAYPAIAGGAAIDQLRGRREFYKAGVI